MKRKLMGLMAIGFAVAMAAVAEEGTPKEGAPKDGAPKEVARKEMRERGRPMMEAREFGEAMIMKALAPDSPMAKELGLTKEQTEALKGVMKGSVEEMKSLQTKMERAGKKQVELMTQDVPDEGAVMKGVEEIGVLRTQIAKSTTRRILAAQRVLTVEQRKKLREMIDSRVTTMRDRRQEGKGPGAGEKRPPVKEGDRPVAPPPPAPAPAAAPAPVPEVAPAAN
jgi:Spy/CpxP family protein refolding chaperone